MKIAGVFLGTAALLFAGLVGQARAEFVVNLQGAAVFTGYNDIRIPGNGGTDISFSDDLAADTEFSGRVEIGYLLGKRNYIGVMASPLSVDSHGSVDEALRGLPDPRGRGRQRRGLHLLALPLSGRGRGNPVLAAVKRSLRIACLSMVAIPVAAGVD